MNTPFHPGHVSCLRNSMSETQENAFAGIVKVCANCYPGKSIFNSFPAWGELNLEISHGICPAHKAQLLEELAALDLACRK